MFRLHLLMPAILSAAAVRMLHQQDAYLSQLSFSAARERMHCGTVGSIMWLGSVSLPPGVVTWDSSRSCDSQKSLY